MITSQSRAATPRQPRPRRPPSVPLDAAPQPDPRLPLLAPGAPRAVSLRRRCSEGLLAAVAALAALAVAAAAAEPPSADALLGQMKASLEPGKPSLRRMTMVVRQEGEETRFTLVQARKALPDGPRSLTVLLAPPDAKGLAYLVAEKRPGEPTGREWLYIPVVRRVRELVPAENYTSFLDTDFTYADLGFIDLHATNRLLGSETVGGRTTFKIESIPGSTTKQWYYSRIVTWIDGETLLPTRREFYSPSNMMFKVETFDSVSRVDGVPTPFKVDMQNLPAGTSTELTVSDVSYGVDIPDEFFGPDKLKSIADLAFWSEKPASKKD